MERFLNYDVYDFNLSRIRGSSSCDLKSLFIGITSESLTLVVDLGQYLNNGSTRGVDLPAVLNFMDGIVSCCGEERVMVFTINSKVQRCLGAQPGRRVLHVCFLLCDFTAFMEVVQYLLDGMGGVLVVGRGG
ncbi:hypothetical protein QJS04_geneDACA002627 [Acorus gramineus]|uniref:Uncharacterized protein n=1 Tax=Acorus gramineus TaxID=55184 RepID=A0AAV9AQC2_ACOGR|nr:hypothetical protein QJS04_geneDACA002627 [Acorus gramineus]